MQRQDVSKFRQSGEPFLVRSLALRLPGGHRIEEHAHDWTQIVFAGDGVLAVEADRHRWIVPPHRALLVPPGLAHRVETIGETRLRTVYLHPDLAPSDRGGIRVLEVAPLLRELILECVRIGMLDRTRDDARHLAHVLADQLGRATDVALALPLPVDPRALRVAERVLADPGADLNLTTLARDAHASPRTIERLFRAETGCSIGRWRQQARLQFAVRRLAEGIPVTRVAMESGYESPSAFTQMFRRSLGVTPARYVTS